MIKAIRFWMRTKSLSTSLAALAVELDYAYYNFLKKWITFHILRMSSIVLDLIKHCNSTLYRFYLFNNS